MVLISKFRVFVSVLLLIACCVAIIFLSVRLHNVKAQAIALRKAYTEVAIGSRVPLVSGLDIEGRPVSIAFDPHKPMIIVVISPVCSYCKQGWPAFDSLVNSSSRPGGPRVVFLDLTNLINEAYLQRHNINRNDFIKKIDCKTVRKYSLQITPQVIAVGRDRMVRGVWSGRFLVEQAKLAAAAVQATP